MRATKRTPGSTKRGAIPVGRCLAALVWLWVLCGCSAVSDYIYIRSEEPAYDRDLAAAYNLTKVNKSLTLDVLPRIQGLPDELLSQSESTVASAGEGKDGYRTWFTMVAFHEYKLTAIRKYFFDVDERVNAWPNRSLRFDCEMALDKQVLDVSYGDENTRRIAILRHVLRTLQKDIEDLRRDMDTPGQNNETLNICGMLIKQVFETVLLRMDASAVTASRLHETGGVEFDHLNFGKGRIRMVVEEDAAKVNIRLGALAQKLGQPPQPDATGAAAGTIAAGNTGN